MVEACALHEKPKSNNRQEGAVRATAVPSPTRPHTNHHPMPPTLPTLAICSAEHTDANHGLAAHGYPAGCFLVKEATKTRVCILHKSASGGRSTKAAALFAGVKGPCTVRGCTRCEDAPAA